MNQTSAASFGKMHSGTFPEIAMLLYPGLTLLDLLGPQTVLASSCHVHLVWKNLEPIETDTGITIHPTTTFADCPPQLDVLFVGGGPGKLGILNDPEVIRFLAERGKRARFVTSVCTGSLLLGAAGLLRGYESACHWACLDLLSLFGAKPVAKRVVVDRNRISGGGVTAGIDFGLVLLEKIMGTEIAKTTQLVMEYAPQPPFDCGSPDKAGPEILQHAREWLGPMEAVLLAACQQAVPNMPAG